MVKRIKIKLLLVQIIALIPFLTFIFYLFDLWYDTQRLMILESTARETMIIENSVFSKLDRGVNIAGTLSEKEYLKLVLDRKYINSDGFPIALANLAGSDNSIKSIDIIFQKSVLSSGSKPLADLGFTETDNLVSRETPVNNSYIITDDSQNLKIIRKSEDDKKNPYYAVITLNWEIASRLMPKNIDSLFNSYLFIADDKGRIIFSQGPDTDSDQINFSDIPEIQSIKQGEVINLENLHLKGINTTLTGSLTKTEYGWIIASFRDTSQIYSPLFKMQNSVWLIIGFALVFFLSVITYYLKKIKIIY